MIRFRHSTILFGAIKYKLMALVLTHSIGQRLIPWMLSLTMTGFISFRPSQRLRLRLLTTKSSTGEWFITSWSLLKRSNPFSRYTLDLSTGGDGSCTADPTGEYYDKECIIVSNVTSHAIIPPVRSARLTTAGTKTIQYGRVEVVAKIPKGDWLWPAIWMMPQDSVYGGWPLSGEIDIMESRGNARGYKRGGREAFSSTLHWGEWR